MSRVSASTAQHALKAGAVIPQDVPSLLHFPEGNAVFLPTRTVARDQRLGNSTDG